MDLAKPITDVSEVMREGGNLASHFDEEGQPIGPELATEMLDLLDAFLDYLGRRRCGRTRLRAWPCSIVILTCWARHEAAAEVVGPMTP